MTLGTVGFVGVGSIAAAMIDGIAGTRDDDVPIVVSPRSRAVVAELSARHAGLVVAPDNRAVVAAADVLVIAVRPEQLSEAVAGCTPRAGQVVVSVLAGVPVEEVRAAMAPAPGVTIVRAIPMPPVRRRAGLTVVTAGDERAVELFDRLGGSLVVTDEDDLSIFSALTGAVSGYLNYVNVLCRWATARGLDPTVAESFVRHLAASLAPAVADTRTPIAEVVVGHETAGGLNEQLRSEFFDEHGTESLIRALDRLRARVGR